MQTEIGLVWDWSNLCNPTSQILWASPSANFRFHEDLHISIERTWLNWTDVDQAYLDCEPCGRSKWWSNRWPWSILKCNLWEFFFIHSYTIYWYRASGQISKVVSIGAKSKTKPIWELQSSSFRLEQYSRCTQNSTYNQT